MSLSEIEKKSIKKEKKSFNEFESFFFIFVTFDGSFFGFFFLSFYSKKREIKTKQMKKSRRKMAKSTQFLVIIDFPQKNRT